MRLGACFGTILMHFKNATLYVGNCNNENFCSLLQLPTYNVAFLKCISIFSKCTIRFVDMYEWRPQRRLVYRITIMDTARVRVKSRVTSCIKTTSIIAQTIHGATAVQHHCGCSTRRHNGTKLLCAITLLTLLPQSSN